MDVGVSGAHIFIDCYGRQKVDVVNTKPDHLYLTSFSTCLLLLSHLLLFVSVKQFLFAFVSPKYEVVIF
jgi:hypothetical protein